MSIRKGKTIIAGNASSLDWTGTLQEYNIALENGIIQPDWVCYITDDTLYTDDIRPEIDRLDNIKSNVDLSNLTQEGEKHFLNKSQITNCITEIPQRIKYTLQDGILTLLTGSVVIVPYGTEDLTAQYPIGSTFIHENFKVVDTQFADGKFFVWAELVSDISNIRTSTDTNERPLYVNLSVNTINAMVNNSSGTQDILTGNQYIYRTDLNICHQIVNSILSADVVSLPIARVVADGTNLYGSFTQIFNGIGYIGSTFWVDKGVKGLAPNGRNEDGTLKNIEFVTNRVIVDTTADTNHYNTLFLNIGTNAGVEEIKSWFADFIHKIKSRAELPLATAQNYQYYFIEDESIWVMNGDTGVWNKTSIVEVGSLYHGADSSITDFETNNAFRAVDYNDKPEISGWSMPSDRYIDLTLGASGTIYTAPANGWFHAIVRIADSDGGLGLRDEDNGLNVYIKNPTTNTMANASMPVRKGARIKLTYANPSTGSLAYSYLAFIYAVGSESEL